MKGIITFITACFILYVCVDNMLHADEMKAEFDRRYLPSAIVLKVKKRSIGVGPSSYLVRGLQNGAVTTLNVDVVAHVNDTIIFLGGKELRLQAWRKEL